jgi:hypothetical protein
MMVLTLSSCTAIEGIFKAGSVVGVICVIVGIRVVVWLISLKKIFINGKIINFLIKQL